MSDIIERLRNEIDPSDGADPAVNLALEDAANELERLYSITREISDLGFSGKSSDTAEATHPDIVTIMAQAAADEGANIDRDHGIKWRDLDDSRRQFALAIMAAALSAYTKHARIPAQSMNLAADAVLAVVDGWTRGAFTGWEGKAGNSRITLDEAEDHFTSCMAGMKEHICEAFKGQVLAPAESVAAEDLARIINPGAGWDRPARSSKHPAFEQEEAEYDAKQAAAYRLAQCILSRFKVTSK